MKHKPTKTGIIGIILSFALMLNLIPLFQTHVEASIDPYNISGKIDSILNNALDWIEKNQNPSGGWGDERLVNDSAYSVYSLRHNARDYADGLSFLTEFDLNENTDTLSHVLSATGLESQYASKLLERQNTDSGFGLDKTYTSEPYDTVLALEAIEEVNDGKYNDTIKKIVLYLLAHQNKDGSWSGNEYNNGNTAFTARAAYAISKYLTENHLTSDSVVSAFAKTNAFLSSVSTTDVSENGLQATLYKQMMRHLNDDYKDVYQTVEAIEKAQMDDGSFYDRFYDTCLVIKYLNSLDTIEDSCRVESFDVALDNNTFLTNEEGVVNGRYTVDYQTVMSKEMRIVTKLYDDDKEIDSFEMPVVLDNEQESVSGNAFSFTVNEPEIKVLKIVSTLYNGSQEVYGSTGYLYVQEKPVVPDTKVTDAGITLGESYGFVGESKEVTSGIYMLYATNVIRRLTTRTTVTCDGKVVAQEEAEIELTPGNTELTLDTTKLVINEASAKTYHYKTQFLSEDTLWYTAEKDYVVYEKPDESQQTSAITDLSISLDDFCAYTANDTQKVNAACEMLFSVYQDFDITVKGSIQDGEQVLYSSEQDVTLTPAKTSVVLDLIEGELDLSSAKAYLFKAELYDSQGNHLGESTEQFKVVARPDMELILSVDTNTGDKYSANFSWNDISNEYEQYGYHLLRSADNGKTWETRSSWDGEKVRVLNIYPISYAKNYLIDWMNMKDPETGEPLGKGLFEIDTVYFDDYNNNPEKCLKNEKGNYRYDVLVFGTYDYNGHKDLNEASFDATQAFIDSGRGVLFGHDTITRLLGYNVANPIFANFDKQVGIKAVEHMNNPHCMKNQVDVINEGFLTSYPWKISGTLNIPVAHTQGQFAGGSLPGTVWMRFQDAVTATDPETGATNDFYLVTNNNLAMIQTGHSNGQATIDECKVFANTLFYLKQATSSGASVDNSFYDEAAPEKPEAELSLTEYKKDSYSISANLTAEDLGSEYRYRVEALPKSGLSDKVLSNTVMTSAFSELRGFVAITTDSEESAASMIEYDTDGKTPLNIIEAENGSAVYEMNELSKNKKYYLHVFAVDNAGNISEEYVKEVYDNEEVLLQAGINSSLVTEKAQYEVRETATLTASSYTTGSTLNATADIVLESLDGTPVTTIAENINKQLTSKAKWSDDYTLSTENLPAGRYMAVLRWRMADTVIAESKCLIKIIAETEDSELTLASAVTTGKEYSNTLTWTDMNNGEGGYVPTDFSVVVDCSGSMLHDNRIGYAKEAVERFIDALNDGDKMSLIYFKEQGSLLHDFSDDKTSLHTATSNLLPVWGDGTSVSSGLNLAKERFDLISDNDHKKSIILICDGDIDNCSSAVEYAVKNDISIYTVNVVNALSNDLQNMASETGGQYFYTNIVYDMAEILQRIRIANDKGDYYYEVMRDGERKGVYSRPKYSDSEFLDEAAPVILSTQLYANEIDDDYYSGRITVKAADTGTDYEYEVNAVDTQDAEHVIRSNKVTAVALSDIKGFVYQINTESTPCPEIAYNDSLFVSSGDDLSIDIVDYKRGEIHYLHVFAVDNNDNYSDETIYRFVVGKPLFESSNITTSISTDKEKYHIGDTVYPDVTARTDFYKVFAKGVIEICDSNFETVEVIEPGYVVEIPSYEDLKRQFAWEAKDVVAGDYYATVKWYDGDTMLASDSAAFTILPDGAINDRLKTDKFVYSVSDQIELTDYIFNNTTNNYANDLDVQIEIIDQQKNTKETITGTASVMAGRTGLFTDSVKAGALGEGSYRAVSSVKYRNEIVATSSTDFEVTDDLSFSGKISVAGYDDRNKKLDYTVTNTRNKAVNGATVRVKIYSADGELQSTIDKKADFNAGETKSFTEIYNIEKLAIGNYPVALSVFYDDWEDVLDETGLVISSLIQYTVTFINDDGTTIETQKVIYGQSAVPPATPVKPSDSQFDYEFVGWDKDFSAVTSDLIVTAQYKAIEKSQDATPDEVTPDPTDAPLPQPTNASSTINDVSTTTSGSSIQTGQSPYLYISFVALIAVYAVLIIYMKKNRKEKEEK